MARTHLGQQENTTQDAQTDDLLTLPTLARQDAPYPRQGHSSAADPRFTFHASRFTVPGSDARTKLAGCFSIMLDLFHVEQCQTSPQSCFRQNRAMHPNRGKPFD